MYLAAQVGRAAGLDSQSITGHAFNIVTEPGGNKWIVDLTYQQFVGGEILSGAPFPLERTHPFVRELLGNGYVPLNSDTLTTYLSSLSASIPDGFTADPSILQPSLQFGRGFPLSDLWNAFRD